MSTTWSTILMQLLTSTLTAAGGTAAGTALTAATANPVIGAAADAAAKKAIEQLLSDFVPAQQEALQRIEGLTQEIHALVGDIDTRVRAQQSGPGRAALLHMEDASRHPENAKEELQIARRLLYEAWGAASDAAQRAFAAQQLSGVYALLGDGEDSMRWLERSLSDSDLAVEEALSDLFDALPSIAYKQKFFGNSGSMAITGSFRGSPEGRISVPADRLLPALSKVVDARNDAMQFRRQCLSLGIGWPWPYPGRARIGSGRTNWYWRVKTPDFDGNVERMGMSPEIDAAIRRTEIVSFVVWDGPWCSQPGKTFLTGPSLELGAWDPAWAIPMSTRPPQPWRSYDDTIPCARVQLFKDADQIEYSYLFVPDDGSAAVQDVVRRKPLLADEKDDWDEESRLGAFDSWGFLRRG